MEAADKRITVKELAEIAGVTKLTVRNWMSRGVRSVKLGQIRVGGRVYTSRRLFDEFNDELSSGLGVAAVPRRTPRQRELAIDRAERELIAMGA